MNEQPSLNELKQTQKKNVKTALFIMSGILVFAVAGLLLLNHFLTKEDDTSEKYIHFYPVDDRNIFENPDYLSLNRSVLFCDDPSGWYGQTTEITAEERMGFDATVRFADDYLNALIYGSESALRAMCSSDYLSVHEISDFTQQMIYEAKIIYHSTEGREGGGKLVTYRLDYKIYKNNGTYRRDVGSDTVKSEYLVLGVSSDESEICIEDILRP